jgi:hypothetical protein
MIKRMVAIFAFSVLVFSAPAGTVEQIGTTMCESRQAVLEFLSTKYAEAPVAMGVAKNGSLVEVLTSGAGSTFTIIVTRPDGTTCMVAAGQGWESVSDFSQAQPRI